MARSPGAPPADATALGARIRAALRWTVAARLAGRGATALLAVFTLRLLTPAEVGLVGMALTVTGFAALVSELSLATAIVQARDAGPRVAGEAFTAVVLASVVTACALVLAAPLAAAFFSAPQLVPVLRVLSLQLPLAALAGISAALLRRELQFKGLSLVEQAAAVAGGALTLTLAVYGLGVWALVAGVLAAALTRTVVVLAVLAPHLRPALGWRALRPLAGFATNLTARRTLAYGARNLDLLIAGRLLGETGFGLYALAMNVVKLPLRLVLRDLQQVTLAAYARTQEDVPRARRYFLRSVEGVSLLMVPSMWGLAAVAEDLLPVVLGAAWRPAAVVVQVASVVLPLRAVARLFTALLDGLGRPGVEFRNLLTVLVVLPPALLAGAPFGLVGLATGWAVGHLVAYLLNFRRSLPALDSGLGALFAAMAPALAAGAAMALVIEAAQAVLALHGAGSLVRLVVATLLGGGVYAACLWLFARDALRRLLALLR